MALLKRDYCWPRGCQTPLFTTYGNWFANSAKEAVGVLCYETLRYGRHGVVNMHTYGPADLPTSHRMRRPVRLATGRYINSSAKMR